MEEFDAAKDDEASEKFETWFKENPEGFYINHRSANDLMLHRSSCHHIVFHRPKRLAAHKKVCSLDRHVLEEYAAKDSNWQVQPCSSCFPRA